MSSEKKYIVKRRAQAFLLSLQFILMRIFPIKKGKIVFSTFEGDGGFCCNPRYIAEKLHEMNMDYEMVWLTRKGRGNFPQYIKVVAYSSWNIAYHLSTAHIWIDNYRKPYGTIKRKRQLYIQTWHASIGFKAVGLYRGDKFPKIARIVSEWDSALADFFISNSTYCNKIYPQKLLYSGPTILSGSPRVDCIINNSKILHEKIRTQYGLKENVNIVLFAPTFRGGNQNVTKQVKAEIPSVCFDELIRELCNKFGGEWYVFLRLHPQLSAKIDKMPIDKEDERLIDVSKEPDISEIMAACDLVITDYSSCAFDACFAKIPVFLYADDVQEYIENRGRFMWKREELPFAMAESNEILFHNIREFDIEQYKKNVEAFMSKHGVLEDGFASGRIADVIVEYIERGMAAG